MKTLTFAEMFTMPPGTIFGQVTGFPHQFSTGLHRLTRTWPEDEWGDATIGFQALTCLEDGRFPWDDSLSEDAINDGYRFLVYEPDDLDRLAGLIGRGGPAEAPASAPFDAGKLPRCTHDNPYTDTATNLETVGDVRRLIAGVPDDLPVYLFGHAGYDTVYGIEAEVKVQGCIEHSGYQHEKVGLIFQVEG
jgi:hypothetical protein